MALAAQSVVEAAGKQDQILLVGVDGLKNACEAILADKLLASVINPAAASTVGDLGRLPDRLRHGHGRGDIPKFIRTDGGPITKDNARRVHLAA